MDSAPPSVWGMALPCRKRA